MSEDAQVSVFTQQKNPAPEDIDELGHVNNAVYVRWIQDIAVAHWYSVAPANLAQNVVWVVVRHEIDYRAPSHLGETLTLRTWVGDAPKGARYDRFVEIAGPDGKVRVRVKGVDVFRPQTGEIESGGTDSIALWMIDTEYNEESFFVRQAYFLGASDPYKALKTTLKAEIDAEAWATLNSDVSRPFEKPKTGRIAVKVIIDPAVKC